MPIIKIFSYFALVLLLDINNSFGKEDNSSQTLKILLIGSSYFGTNNLPNLLNNISFTGEKSVDIHTQIQSGLYLEDHSNSIATENKINEQKWDYVILQGVGRITAYPEIYKDHPVYPALFNLQDKILRNYSKTIILYCLPWAYEDGMTWLKGWTDTYEDMQIKIYNNTLKYMEKLNISIAPVGWAWYHVLKEKNYPLHYLHVSDWNHPSLKGSYLMACVLFSSIFQEKSDEINYYANIPENEAKYFQSIASQIVLDSLRLWNITPITSINENHRLKFNFRLYQNYPNPFNPNTTIKFSIPSNNNRAALDTKLIIYDSIGNVITVLIDEKKFRGDYEVNFNCSGLSSGVYYYRIICGNYHQTKKMIYIK